MADPWGRDPATGAHSAKTWQVCLVSLGCVSSTTHFKIMFWFTAQIDLYRTVSLSFELEARAGNSTRYKTGARKSSWKAGREC